MGRAGGRIVKQQCPHVRDTKARADNARLSMKFQLAQTRLPSKRAWGGSECSLKATIRKLVAK
jgi:hypothetical protein